MIPSPPDWLLLVFAVLVALVGFAALVSCAGMKQDTPPTKRRR